jgi:GTPase SAR1 family protein
MMGDSAVGKTNLLLRYTKGGYNPHSKGTVGIEFTTKVLKIENQVVKA